MLTKMDSSLKDGDVASADNIVTVEDLPKKYVFYPGFYGAFFGFASNFDEFPTFCSCSKKAIESYLNLRVSEEHNNAIPERNFILDSMHFPYRVVTTLMSKDIKHDQSIISYLKFEDDLCHLCNKKVPKYEYCHEMYGGRFKRMYGWYINQKGFEIGLPSNYNMPGFSFGNLNLSNFPEELKEIIEELPTEPPPNYWAVRTGLTDMPMKEVLEKQSRYGKILRRLGKYIENLVRDKLGYKRVGEGWITETSIYYIIRNIFPDYNVIHHYRPKILEGLELDIFIEELNLGIEFQGLQHYKPLSIFGGETGFEEIKKRDKKKKMLCETNSIKLIYIKFNDKITESEIRKIIKSNTGRVKMESRQNTLTTKDEKVKNHKFKNPRNLENVQSNNNTFKLIFIVLGLLLIICSIACLLISFLALAINL